MAIEDWLPDGDPDDDGYEREVRCDLCRQICWWGRIEGGWRLTDDEGELHQCKARVASAKEFPCVDS